MSLIGDIYGESEIRDWWSKQEESLVYSAPEDIQSLAEEAGYVFPSEDDLLEFIQLGLTNVDEAKKQKADEPSTKKKIAKAVGAAAGAAAVGYAGYKAGKAIANRDRGTTVTKKDLRSKRGEVSKGREEVKKAGPANPFKRYMGSDARVKRVRGDLADEKKQKEKDRKFHLSKVQDSLENPEGAETLMHSKIRSFFEKHESKFLDINDIKKLAEEEGFEFTDRAALYEFVRIGLEDPLVEADEEPITEAQMCQLEEAYDSIVEFIAKHYESGEPLDLGTIRLAAEQAGLVFENLGELKEFAQFIVPALVEGDDDKKPGFIKRWGGRIIKAGAALAVGAAVHKAVTDPKVAGAFKDMRRAFKKDTTGGKGLPSSWTGKRFMDVNSLEDAGSNVVEAGEDGDASAPLSNIDMDSPAGPEGDDFPAQDNPPEVDAKGAVGPSSDTEEMNGSGSQDPAMGSGKAPEGGSKGSEGPASDTEQMNSTSNPMKECPVCSDMNAGHRAMCQKCGCVLPVNPNDNDGGMPAQGQMFGGAPTKENPQSDPGEIKGVRNPFGGMPNKKAYIESQPTGMSPGRKIESSATVVEKLLRGELAREVLAKATKNEARENTGMTSIPALGVVSSVKPAKAEEKPAEVAPAEEIKVETEEPTELNGIKFNSKGIVKPETLQKKLKERKASKEEKPAVEEAEMAQAMPVQAAPTAGGAPSADAVNSALAAQGFHALDQQEIDLVHAYFTQLGENALKVAKLSGHPLEVVQAISNMSGLGDGYKVATGPNGL